MGCVIFLDHLIGLKAVLYLKFGCDGHL
jgi:hypothetical protein